MAVFGAFGKMPGLGDFFRFGVAADFVAGWDVWLQSGILAARAALAGRWDDCYLSAPIWRFTLAPGLAGAEAAQGVLMASVDQAGRQFPLTLVRALPDGVDPVAAHLSAGAQFDALEKVALSALDQDLSAASLKERLSPIPASNALEASDGAAAPGFLWLRASDPAPALAAMLAGREFPRPAVFSALMPGGQCLFLSAGMPPAARFAQLIDPAGLQP
ncbi:type VI secretion system-associated protein TagF [Paracoccus sp. NGMCC 1.201697]|uniref:Type VI secretion system-associated protein TagF n=1 Tax=Paracoccus broussonetiae subsp. drimophilus TaxID=3373869 RepID=A0ABW7LG56_9RHOB